MYSSIGEVDLVCFLKMKMRLIASLFFVKKKTPQSNDFTAFNI